MIEKHSSILLILDIILNEPCNYPGVNISICNPLRENFGICDCEKPVMERGNETCKKITVAVLKVVRLLSTGRDKSDISVAMNLITELIKENK